MNKKVNFEILNSFIHIIIMDIAKKYFKKLKQDEKKPHILIQNYLNKSVILAHKHEKLEISQIKNAIYDMTNEEQIQFTNLFKENDQYQGYEELCKELNFVFSLIKDEKIQTKTLELLYENCFEIKFFEEENLIIKKQVDINSVIAGNIIENEISNNLSFKSFSDTTLVNNHI